MPEFAAESIRPAKPEDARVVQALVRSSYAKWVAVIGREPLPMAADYNRAVRDHEIDLVEANGELLGLIELIRNPDHLFIENVAVTPAHQRRGIGRRLLAHAERKAADYAVAEIRLATNSAFESNVRFYQSVGYRIDRREPFMGGAAVYMCKEIRSS
jgi:ribosomal protein S18 acetylase RimI-like enzyme